MWSDIVNNLLALAVGLITGFYFERRATKAVRIEAELAKADVQRLEERLRNLKVELFGRHIPSADKQEPPAPDSQGLIRKALAFARERQDASGCIKSTTLRNGLVEQGFPVAEVDAAIQALADDNSLLRDGPQWKVRA